jgi:hypothetical protein
MVKTYLIKQQLTPEQNKVLDEVLFERENTVLAYKILSKQYGDTKRKIKQIEKRLVELMQRQPENQQVSLRWIEYEIAAIENKYPVIDKAIKYYKEQMKYCDQFLSRPDLRTFNPEHQSNWHISGMQNHLRQAHMYIERGVDAIRITKRYFEKITTAFKSNELHQKTLRSQALRRAEMEARAAAEPPPVNPVEEQKPEQEAGDSSLRSE